jgi:probable addiction module antidote protein
MPISTEPFDVADYLTSPEAISLFLTEVLEDNDPREFVQALSAVARARGGITKLASSTGLTVEALHHALEDNGTIELGTILKIMQALKLKLTASVSSEQPIAA